MYLRDLKLLSCKRSLVNIIVVIQSELGLYGPEPAISFQRFIHLMKKQWLSIQELLIPQNRRLMVIVISISRSSTLLHELTEECRLLIAPS